MIIKHHWISFSKCFSDKTDFRWRKSKKVTKQVLKDNVLIVYIACVCVYHDINNLRLPTRPHWVVAVRPKKEFCCVLSLCLSITWSQVHTSGNSRDRNRRTRPLEPGMCPFEVVCVTVPGIFCCIGSPCTIFNFNNLITCFVLFAQQY